MSTPVGSRKGKKRSKTIGDLALVTVSSSEEALATGVLNAAALVSSSASVISIPKKVGKQQKQEAAEEGYLKRVYANRDRYEGFVDAKGKRSGFGQFTFSNGDSYRGNWHESKMHGKGLFVWGKSGDRLSCYWKHGHIDGEGKKTCLSDGSVLTGYFCADGKVSGLGEFCFANGDKYRGLLQSDERWGWGTYTWLNNSTVFSGYWCRGEKIGQGEVTTNLDVASALKALTKEEAEDSVAFYSGSFERDERHGTGHGKMYDSSIYAGEWKDGMFHGWGSLFYCDGMKYQGDFLCGVRAGFGLITRARVEEEHQVEDEILERDWALAQAISILREDGFSVLDLLNLLGFISYHGEWAGDAPQGAGVISKIDEHGTVLESFVGEFNSGMLVSELV